MLRKPIFILTAARSGSTLLRCLLDAHPDISCPPETRVVDLIDSARNTAGILYDDRSILRDLLESTKAYVENLVCPLLDQKGSTRWSDKSIINLDRADLLGSLWNDAQFVCLYRHPMDVIHSLLMANAWEFKAYGFEDYIRASPTRPVEAAAQYWLDRANRLFTFEQHHPESCFRLRYEDLVECSEVVCKALSVFLDLKSDLDFGSGRFDELREGPGDHQIWFTEGPNRSFIGEGYSVPAGAIADSTRNRINELLPQIGYQPIDGSWGLPLPDGVFPGSVVTVGSREPYAGTDDTIALASSPQVVVMRGSRPIWASMVEHLEIGAGRSIEVVCVDADCAVGLIHGLTNIGQALRWNSIRIYSSGPSAGASRYLQRELAPFIDTLRRNHHELLGAVERDSFAALLATSSLSIAEGLA